MNRAPAAVARGAHLTPPDQRVPLVDLLDRVLAKGVVVSGEVTISIAEVDLIHISLRALLSSVRPGVVPTLRPSEQIVAERP